MSTIARALGVASEDRFQKYWRMGDADQVVAASRTEWESWGMSEADALRHARSHFTAGFSEAVHECTCGGAGCGAPGPQILWPDDPGVTSTHVEPTAAELGD